MSKLQGNFGYRKYLLLNLCIAICAFKSCESLSDKTDTCVKVNACKCMFATGEGIDLTNLTVNMPANWLNVSDTKSIFYFHPCFNVPMPGENECTDGSALCMYNKTSRNFMLLGKAEEATFVSGSVKSEDIFIQYIHNNFNSTVKLMCGLSSKSSSLEILNTTANINRLHLHSPLACLVKMSSDTDNVDHSLSTGSMLVILFFTFFAVYFIVGAVVLKITRGAEGKELIPNYDFWAGLPLLCKDGITFAVGGCKATRSYDSI